MKPGFIPSRNDFLATITIGGSEDVIKDNAGAPIRFPSAAAAMRFAKKRANEIWLRTAPPKAETQEERDARLHRQWKLEKAEELRQVRESFDMRGVEVVTKKRRIPCRP